jgi:hypothetical protein
MIIGSIKIHAISADFTIEIHAPLSSSGYVEIYLNNPMYPEPPYVWYDNYSFRRGFPYYGSMIITTTIDVGASTHAKVIASRSKGQSGEKVQEISTTSTNYFYFDLSYEYEDPTPPFPTGGGE